MTAPISSTCYCTRCRCPIPDDISLRQGVCDDCLAFQKHNQSTNRTNYIRWFAICFIVLTAVVSLWMLNDIAVKRRTLRVLEDSQREAREQTERYMRDIQNPPTLAPEAKPAEPVRPSNYQYRAPYSLPAQPSYATAQSSSTYVAVQPVPLEPGEVDWDGNLAFRKAAAVMVEDFIRQSNPGRPWPASTRETQPLPAWCEPGWNGMIRRPSHQYIFGARGPIGAKGAGLMDFTVPESTPTPTRP